MGWSIGGPVTTRRKSVPPMLREGTLPATLSRVLELLRSCFTAPTFACLRRDRVGRLYR